MVENFLSRVKNDIKDCLEKKQYEDALILIRMCADITYCYNQYFCDDTLENYLREISENVLSDTKIDNVEKNKILFYDGFGYNDRGLIQIYLKALCRIGQVIYITKYKARKNIPDVLHILNQNNGISIFLENKDFVNQIKFVNSIVEKYRPAHMFMYTYPHDVVIPVVFNKYAGIIKRYQINLTDHAFWIGKAFFDYCIEFRDWGASLSYFYREIDLKKIVMLPYYPNINWEQEFLGYPFPFDENKQRFIFSGGQLYKTLGRDNKYYKIIDNILNKYPDLIFWYAGSGNRSEMDKIIKKYPSQLYLTSERKDFFQILQRCEFYLSTYPICGGLMFQYAAAAGKIPVTLNNDDFTEGFLLCQKELEIGFENANDLLTEVNNLLNDKKYLASKSTKMLKAVLTPEIFENELKKLLDRGKTDIGYSLERYDLSSFKSSYYDNFNYDKMLLLVASYKKWIVVRRYTKDFFKGRILRLKNKILKNLNK